MISTVAIIGFGQIGRLVAKLLDNSKKHRIFVLDKNINQIGFLNFTDNITFLDCDIRNRERCIGLFSEHNIHSVISCLPYFENIHIARLAKELNLNYFDLTEDVKNTEAVKKLSIGAKAAFIPQCGLAPGFVGIVANTIASKFESLDTIKLRVGALPISPANAFKYSFTWSVEGVINEYCELCPAIQNEELVQLQPLEGLELISIDGLNYECFTTSGGIGALAEIYKGKVKNMVYKTIRYPGHCDMLRFLINDLKLINDRDTLQRILVNAVPRSLQDIVLIYVSVIGKKDGVLLEENYVKKVYGRSIGGQYYNAIQTTTAGGVCAVVDKVLTDPEKYKGFVRQEDFVLDDVIHGPFGHCYE